VPYAPSWTQVDAETDDDAEEEIAFEEEAETPPIPPGELPAFAAPPNAPTGWSVDPETGEKVHLGPIELTFDGPVVPPQQRGAGRGRLALFGAAGLLAAATVVAWFIVRGEGTPDATPPGKIASRAVGTDSPGAEAASQGAAPADTAPQQPPEGAPPAPQASPAPVDRPDVPAPPAGAAGTEPAPSTEGVPLAAADFGFGQRLLDAGTIDRAAEAFRRAIEPIPAGRFTLQTMIACEAETVRKARAGTRPDGGLFVLSTSVRGRSCYRVMWGVFETRAAAAAARADLPRYFGASGVVPAIVAIDRLRPSS
jgi:hypothetical protein